MTESLYDFIHRRRAELDAAEKPLVDQIKAIKAEREQLRRAALAAGLEDEPAPGPMGDGGIPKRSPRRIPEKTIKEAVLSSLMVVGGKTALEILKEINDRHGTDYPRTSLSPQLSRLKADNLVKRDGNVWSLTLKGTVEADRLAFEAHQSASSELALEPGKAGGT